MFHRLDQIIDKSKQIIDFGFRDLDNVELLIDLI